MRIYFRTGISVIISCLISIALTYIYNSVYSLLPIVLSEDFVIWLRIVLALCSMMVCLEFFGRILDGYQLWPWFSTSVRDKIVFAMGFGILLTGTFLLISLRFLPSWIVNFLMAMFLIGVYLSVYFLLSDNTKQRIQDLRKKSG